MGGSRHIGFRALHVSLIVGWLPTRASPRSRKRTFSERYLLLTQLRNLILPEDTATKRPLRAFITPNLWPRALALSCRTSIVMLSEVKHPAQCHRQRSFINRTAWAGWVAYLGKRAMRRPVSGISKEVSPTSFLCPYVDRIHNLSINLMLKRGEVVGEGLWYGRNWQWFRTGKRILIQVS